MASAGSAGRAGDLIDDAGSAESEAGRTPGDVARELGVSVVTLRSWERRYGIGPVDREPGRHRRYLDADIALLRRMCDLIGNGMAPARAAELARRSTQPVGSPSPASPRSGAAPNRSAAIRGLLRTATRMDDLGCRSILERALAERGVIGAWDELMMPALIAIGQRYAATGRCVEVEHLLSVTISAVLGSVRRPSAASTRQEILLSCADEEQHSLALEALAAALAERGTGVRLLGARTPATALDDALRATSPTVVLLWSQVDRTGDPAQLERLLAQPPHPVLVAAGPGWPADDVPERVHRPTDLSGATRLLDSFGGTTERAGTRPEH